MHQISRRDVRPYPEYGSTIIYHLALSAPEPSLALLAFPIPHSKPLTTLASAYFWQPLETPSQFPPILSWLSSSLTRRAGPQQRGGSARVRHGQPVPPEQHLLPAQWGRPRAAGPRPQPPPQPPPLPLPCHRPQSA